MKNAQQNLFGGARIEFDECVKLTIQSLETYGPLYNHWAIAWSGGKDSTTLLTLLVQLMESGQVRKPNTFTVFYADTGLELTPLQISAYSIIEQLKTKGIDVRIVKAEMDKRFMVYMLGRGVPPPNNNTLRWCTRQIKVEPMNKEVLKLAKDTGEKILMLTGVRQGESAIRDGRISMSCSKNGAECGQGWFQDMKGGHVSTLAPLLHWRVCTVWDWLKIFAPSKKYGGWHTELLADVYGGDEAEEMNARTGCMGCPLAQKDTALEYVCKLPEWSYLEPLLGLKPIFRWLRLKQNRHRKNGDDFKKDGTLTSNPQRFGPITLKARKKALERILSIQDSCNAVAVRDGKPLVIIIDADEEERIRELIKLRTFPNRWTGEEITGDVIVESIYADGSIQKRLF